jgi:hypothetical protein
MGSEEFKSALQEAREVELTVTGRVSGRQTSRPLWFVQAGDTLYLLPVTGSDSDWYKNLLKTPEISLAVNGAELRGKAQPIEDAAAVGDVVERFGARYGAETVEDYYPNHDVAVEVQLA